jgi:DNA invertase Pin-like site-specific DNA recombinase
MNVAIYLRLSLSDGDLEENGKKESNSIENQRLLLRDYILKRPELYGEVIEYVDDGYSGTNFNRPGFQQMITDARNGLIQVILAKDLSRLGRNYVEMGDYLDQIFPRLGVRVIAVNSGYDSKDHVGDVSGLDAAITNFVNAMYVRDLSMKRKSSYMSLLKRGISINAMVPYGYYHEIGEPGRWHVDEEAAKVVKKLFELAASGKRAMEIVNYLNAEGIDPPGYRKEQKYGIPKSRVVTDHEYLWDYPMVRRIIMDASYLGTLRAHRTETMIYGYKKVRHVPEEDWVIIEGHHEPLIDRETFDAAQLAIKRKCFLDRRKPAIYSLKTKLRCANCHLAFRYLEDDSAFYCRHRGMAGKYSKCSQRLMNYPLMENLIFQTMKKSLEDLGKIEALLRSDAEKINPVRETKQREAEGKASILKAERVRQYEGFAAGLITKEAYLKKKESLTKEIERLEADISNADKEKTEDAAILRGLARGREKADHVIESDQLTRSMAEAFIRNVYVYDENRIEIEYMIEDLVMRAVERHNEITEALSVEGGGEVSHRFDSPYVKALREKNKMSRTRGKTGQAGNAKNDKKAVKAKNDI